VALWFTFGGLGYRQSRRVRLGATLLTAAAVFWTEPVIRTIYLGQVNLELMALIIWDLCQPDTKASRWWKGAGVGIAAGIKLVPLIFIPYLLVARKFRQAAVASAAFAASVVAGFAFLPADSAKWWFGGVFFNGAGRTGFVGWEGNQSLRGLMTRLMGSVAGSEHAWLAVAAFTAVVGVASAALLDRKGHPVAGMVTCALTGLLVSPISWDHHWVWIVPGVAVAGHYAVRSMAAARARRAAPAQTGQASTGQAGTGQAGTGWAVTGWAERARGWASSRLAWGYWSVAGCVLILYGAWPGSLWSRPRDMGPFSLGVIWDPPNTNLLVYNRFGDLPSFPEYHWHGHQLIIGNAYVLGGLALLCLLVALAWLVPAPSPAPAASAATTTTTATETAQEQYSPTSASGIMAAAGQDVTARPVTRQHAAHTLKAVLEP
jgi:hypothetical protein